MMLSKKDAVAIAKFLIKEKECCQKKVIKINRLLKVLSREYDLVESELGEMKECQCSKS